MCGSYGVVGPPWESKVSVGPCFFDFAFRRSARLSGRSSVRAPRIRRAAAPLPFALRRRERSVPAGSLAAPFDRATAGDRRAALEAGVVPDRVDELALERAARVAVARVAVARVALARVAVARVAVARVAAARVGLRAPSALTLVRAAVVRLAERERPALDPALLERPFFAAPRFVPPRFVAPRFVAPLFFAAPRLVARFFAPPFFAARLVAFFATFLAARLAAFTALPTIFFGARDLLADLFVFWPFPRMLPISSLTNSPTACTATVPVRIARTARWITGVFFF
jgi:hypothetical protein